jgi:excisionase family DNA binding protein
MEETILTVEQVAQILQVHPFTVLKFIKQGKLKASKLGRVYRIRRSDVDSFLDSLAQESSKKVEPAKRKGKKADKDISQDSSLTDESKEAPLEEKTKISQAEKKERTQEDHYVIDFTI